VAAAPAQGSAHANQKQPEIDITNQSTRISGHADDELLCFWRRKVAATSTTTPPTI
jgi:hypothetical protein